MSVFHHRRVGLENEIESIIMVRLLGDIPMVDALFDEAETARRKTELYIVITPPVIRRVVE